MCSFCKTRGASREERQEGMKKDAISHSMYNASPKYARASSNASLSLSCARAIPSRTRLSFPREDPDVVSSYPRHGLPGQGNAFAARFGEIRSDKRHSRHGSSRIPATRGASKINCRKFTVRFARLPAAGNITIRVGLGGHTDIGQTLNVGRSVTIESRL